ncbi:MAG: hypothetical protein ABR878_00950 [Roseiarcus sp.]|jgi:hypothetical protein
MENSLPLQIDRILDGEDTVARKIHRISDLTKEEAGMYSDAVIVALVLDALTGRAMSAWTNAAAQPHAA